MYQTAATIQVAEQLNTDFVLPTKSHAGHYGDISPDFSGFAYDFKFQDVSLPNKFFQPTFGYTPIDVKNDLELNGFYQAHQYFDNIRDKLINKYFKFSDEVIEQASKYEIPPNALGLSFRRGDYIQLQHNHCVLSTQYYQDAIDKIVGFPENVLDEYFIFSDDLPWCESLLGSNCTYVKAPPFVQLYLMTQMKNLVLSNSTFAWWGGYMNDKGGKIVIPDPWFGTNNFHHDTSGLYCPNWIKQKHEIVLV
jgi:hypothetical protein